MINSLSEIQKEIVNCKDKRFIVKACPGSGKTFSIAARLIEKLCQWEDVNKGIATISFTNTAWKEINSKIQAHLEMKTKIKYPHFLGTIDSFLNIYLFLPFGHLVMGCKKRPELVGGQQSIWNGRGFYEDQFTNIAYDLNGNHFILNPRKIGDNIDQKKLFSTKTRINRSGYATQDDANYFSLQVLKKYPSLAKSLVKRFPIIQIDEAQDTTEIQMEIINILDKSGLEELILIGDPDQAIYEWNNAKPKIFLDKCNEWKVITLNENRRSSQKICDFYSRISSISKINAINTEIKEFELEPEIWEYIDTDIEKIVADFLVLCRSHGMNPETQRIGILVRSNDLINLIMGGESSILYPWIDDDFITYEYVKGKYLYEKKSFVESFKCIERAVYKTIKGDPNCTKAEIDNFTNKNHIKWRLLLREVIAILPSTNLALGEWINNANESLLKFKFFINHRLNIKTDIVKENKISEYSKLSIYSLFYQNNQRFHASGVQIGTVHSVKGETLEAILLVVKQTGSNGKKYSNILKEKIIENEDLRIIYVALSRPRKILVLAVPKGDKSFWLDKFHPLDLFGGLS